MLSQVRGRMGAVGDCVRFAGQRVASSLSQDVDGLSRTWPDAGGPTSVPRAVGHLTGIGSPTEGRGRRQADAPHSSRVVSLRPGSEPTR